jgi:putative transposase
MTPQLNQQRKLSMKNFNQQSRSIDFSTVFAGQAVGIKEVHDDIWLASLGYFDLDTRVLEPLDTPFGPRLSPM